MQMLQFKELKKQLTCTEDPTRDGSYSLFFYEDSPEWMTAYNETTQIEYYLTKEEFKKIYKI